MIALRIPTIPIAQPRQRTTIRTTRDGKIFTGNYTPANHPVRQFKADVRAAVSRVLSAPLEGPVALRVVFVLPRPKRLIWKRREMPRVPHTSRPDLDNLVKSTKDALNGLAWRDDSQVVELSAGKCYASGNELPGVEIAIEIAHDCTLLRGEE